MIFCMLFNKHKKVVKPLFWEKCLFCPKWGKCYIFGPTVFIRFLWSCTWWEALKIRKKKVTALDFKGKILICPKWVKWVIFGNKIHTFELFSKSLREIFLKFYLMTGINPNLDGEGENFTPYWFSLNKSEMVKR